MLLGVGKGHSSTGSGHSGHDAYDQYDLNSAKIYVSTNRLHCLLAAHFTCNTATTALPPAHALFHC
jgi:hypothetical protein